MKKISLFILTAMVCIGSANAVVRDANTQSRNAPTPQITVARAATKSTNERTATNNNRVTATTRDITTRDAAHSSATGAARSAVTRTSSSRSITPATTPARNVTTQRNATPVKTTVTRNATSVTGTMSETKTGAEYEQCKNAYFTCMDQFCKVKNDDYRRCSCSDRIYALQDTKTVMHDAGVKLTEFTENLDTVGMTYAQSSATRTSSEGEDALTADGSASKALLQAIMNSIRGGDTNVGGKFSELNSINLAFDTTNAFGMQDTGQAIAAYNGKNLYTAIYGQCRKAVRDDCNDASLQRAVTAYLMAVEQDCNTVQTAINENKKQMTAAVREGSAMLDLARIENRKNLNSDDMTACLNNVQAAVLSEEVCGSNYHKCLDNGEFIDLTTGAPIAGVVKFYELEGLLKFNEGTSLADQRLSKVTRNRLFVQNFEKRVKKFAMPALNKCSEKSDQVWEDYLDKAMLDIYYAQKSKVSEIKEGCFDFVSSCYVNGDNALTTAMAGLTGMPGVLLQPDKISLNSAVCREYVASCDNMFDGNIVKQYIENRESTDTLSACRAVAKQCFDKFGGASYENFYYPYSGLFQEGNAANWFSLKCDSGDCSKRTSECAKQLSQIPSCADPDMMEKAFGGLDYVCNIDLAGNPVTTECGYGMLEDAPSNSNYKKIINERALRSSGVATEIYYQVIDILTTQCNNLQGRFVELQFLKKSEFKQNNICLANFLAGGEYHALGVLYGVADGENMCPRDYKLGVDTTSWGACLCWENGARRSKWGNSVKCLSEMPVNTAITDGTLCSTLPLTSLTPSTPTTAHWCTQGRTSTTNQVCPFKAGGLSTDGECLWDNGTSNDYLINIHKIPKGIY